MRVIFFQIGTYDIALIELKDFMPRDGPIQPVCLPPTFDEDDKNPDSKRMFQDLDCDVSIQALLIGFFRDLIRNHLKV